MRCVDCANAARGRPASAPIVHEYSGENRENTVKTFGFVLAAVMAVALSACFPPTTTHPVGTTLGIKTDPVLAGTWKADPSPDDPPGKFYYFHFLQAKDGGLLVLLVPSSSGDESDVIVAKITTARFARFGIMNATLIQSPDGNPMEGVLNPIPILYRLDDKGRMTLFLPDEDATKDAIKAGKIAGDAGQSGTTDAVITADGPALDAFIQSTAGQALYKKPMTILTKID